MGYSVLRGKLFSRVADIQQIGPLACARREQVPEFRTRRSALGQVRNAWEGCSYERTENMLKGTGVVSQSGPA
jgi:hypothetical protein